MLGEAGEVRPKPSEPLGAVGIQPDGLFGIDDKECLIFSVPEMKQAILIDKNQLTTRPIGRNPDHRDSRRRNDPGVCAGSVEHNRAALRDGGRAAEAKDGAVGVLNASPSAFRPQGRHVGDRDCEEKRFIGHDSQFMAVVS